MLYICIYVYIDFFKEKHANDKPQYQNLAVPLFTTYTFSTTIAPSYELSICTELNHCFCCRRGQQKHASDRVWHLIPRLTFYRVALHAVVVFYVTRWRACRVAGGPPAFHVVMNHDDVVMRSAIGCRHSNDAMSRGAEWSRQSCLPLAGVGRASRVRIGYLSRFSAHSQSPLSALNLPVHSDCCCPASVDVRSSKTIPPPAQRGYKLT